MPTPSGELHAVTFDCWNTLIVEQNPEMGFELRLRAYHRMLIDGGRDVMPARAELSLAQAWQRHARAWSEGRSTGAPEVARWALEPFGLADDGRVRELSRVLSECRTEEGVVALPGARETLERLRARGTRVALICDTGLITGQSTRALLDEVGLLSSLEVLIFSDEAGVPKPSPRVFHAALEGLGVRAEHTVHVGDIRRTDIAGARQVGMGAIRIRAEHDDVSDDHPEGDHVVDSHAQLQQLLGC